MTKFRAALAVFFFGLASIAYAQAPSTPTAIQTLINQNIPDGQTGGVRANQVRPTFNSLLPFTYLYYDTMTGLLKNFNGTSWVTYTLPISQLGTFPTMTVACNPAGSAASFSSCTLSSTLAFTGSALGVANSVALPGSPSTTTQAATDNSTKIATTAFIWSQLPTINMISYGADPTGAVDSCGAPLTNALAALPSNGWTGGGGIIYWPRGYYLCGTQISVANKNIAFVGDGPDASVVAFTSATANSAGFNISQSSQVWATRFEGLSIRTTVNQVNGNAGILVTYPTGNSGVLPTAIFNNLDVSSGSGNTNYWANGIACTYCWLGIVQNTNIRGKGTALTGAGAGTNMVSGILLTGTTVPATGGGSEGFHIIASNINFANNAVSLVGDDEGVHIIGNDFVAVDYGINAVSGTDSPGGWFQNNHIAAYYAGIQIAGWQQMTMSVNLIYKRSDSTNNFTCFFVGSNGGYSSFYNIISDNTCVNTASSGSMKAIGYSQYSGYNKAFGNLCIGCDYFADFANGTNRQYTHDNQMEGTVSGGWFSSVSGNSPAVAYNNYPAVIGGDGALLQFGTNVTTPGVGGFNQRTWLTHSTSATTITNILNGYVDQKIQVICNDTNTTIQNNGNIGLGSGSNYTCPRVGATISLTLSDVWRETARTP